MQLHELPRILKPRRAVRIGRGGKRGSYSGRGVKGQKSRAGRRIRPSVRDLILRIPKRRGFRNKTVSDTAFPINVGALNRVLAPLREGTGMVMVTREVLQSIGIIPDSFQGTVKILSGGELSFPIELRGFSTSQSAKIKIEKAGGKIVPRS